MIVVVTHTYQQKRVGYNRVTLIKSPHTLFPQTSYSRIRVRICYNVQNINFVNTVTAERAQEFSRDSRPENVRAELLAPSDGAFINDSPVEIASINYEVAPPLAPAG